MTVVLHVDVFVVLLKSKLVDLCNKLSCPLGKYSDNFFKSSDLLRRSVQYELLPTVCQIWDIMSGHSVKHGDIEECEGTYQACLFCYRLRTRLTYIAQAMLCAMLHS
jgi:hypothetical protein